MYHLIDHCMRPKPVAEPEEAVDDRAATKFRAFAHRYRAAERQETGPFADVQPVFSRPDTA